MNFNQLLAFYEIARQPSFTGAAKNLAISQPAVMRRILEMERNEAIKRAVEGNIGLAFFPPSVVDAEIKQGEMKALKISGARLGLSFNVLYHQEKRSSQLIWAFMEVIKEQRPKPARTELNMDPASTYASGLHSEES